MSRRIVRTSLWHNRARSSCVKTPSWSTASSVIRRTRTRRCPPTPNCFNTSRSSRPPSTVTTTLVFFIAASGFPLGSATLTTVTRYNNDVILVGPGDYRSNASTFFMGDTRDGLAPHEIGHLMDNPDEYEHGAIDTSLNEDGATAGIDPDCIMGQNLTSVKKRHYHAFGIMLQRIINTAYSNNDAFDTVAR